MPRHTRAADNPLTKEPKLDQARRIGGERWAELDEKVRDFTDQRADADASGRPAKEEL